MATAKWATPSAVGSNILGTTADSLANGSTSAFVEHDNSSNLDLYASVEIDLGSLTPATGGSITLRVFVSHATSDPDNTGSVGGGEPYTMPLTTATGAKKVIVPMIRLYPSPVQLCLTNNAGVALAASGNSLKVRPYNESVT
jgi:acetaldehyde dehydrogenase (acetylating)